MYITAHIESAGHEADVVPAKAIVSFEGEEFIFVSSDVKSQFEIVKIKTGGTTNEFTEIHLPDGFDKNSSIVINGAFDLLGMLRNTEEE